MLSSPVEASQSTKEISRGLPQVRRATCRISHRDVRLLSFLADSQFLTTSQICRQYFPSIHRARKRLNQLWWSGYVRRVKISPGIESLSAEAVYSISRIGLRLLRAHGEHDLAVSIPKPPKRPGSLMFLSHTLLRNSFRIALENSVCLTPPVALHDWKHDDSLTQFALVLDARTQALKKVVLKADAHFWLKKNDREVEFYLEVDNGTMSLTRLVEKLKAYQVWRRAQQNTNGERHPEVRVLVLLFSSKRAQNLVSKIGSQFSDSLVKPLWLIAHVSRTGLISTNVLEDLRWKRAACIQAEDVSLLNELERFANGQSSCG